MNAENSVTQQVVIATNVGLLADLSPNEGLRNQDSVLADAMFLFGPIANVIVAGLDKQRRELAIARELTSAKVPTAGIRSCEPHGD